MKPTNQPWMWLMALLLVANSCALISPYKLTKEERQQKHYERKKEAAKAKVNALAKTYGLMYQDTIIISDTTIISRENKDTVVDWKTLQVYDTIKLDTGRLIVRVVRLPGDSILINGSCEPDTIIKERPIYIERPLVNEVDVWWKHFKSAVGRFWWLLLLLMAMLLVATVGRKYAWPLIKRYLP